MLVGPRANTQRAYALRRPWSKVVIKKLELKSSHCANNLRTSISLFYIIGFFYIRQIVPIWLPHQRITKCFCRSSNCSWQHRTYLQMVEIIQKYRFWNNNKIAKELTTDLEVEPIFKKMIVRKRKKQAIYIWRRIWRIYRCTRKLSHIFI